MPRLIDANKLIGDLHNHAFLEGNDREIAYSVIQKQPTIGGWISVKDKLPEPNHAVLAYATSRVIWAVAIGEDGNWYAWGSPIRKYEPFWNGIITHWQYFPEPPKEES